MRSGFLRPAFVFLLLVIAAGSSQAQTNSPSFSPKHVRKPATADASTLDVGTFINSAYRNRELAFTCKVPAGWVLRTDEVNAHDENEASNAQESDPKDTSSSQEKPDAKNPAKSDGRVLLAAFSRPPKALGEDVNSSILIAAENAAAYPGLKEPAQYFGPLTEVANAQGFTVVNEPYEFPVGAKSLVREDFQKSVGSRVMRQSTLVMLVHGYALSFTFIGGTEEEIEDLISGLSFTPARNAGK
jgi:hypothetical protein